MQISSADEKAKIEAAITEKTAMYTGIMNTAGKEIRALQEVYGRESSVKIKMEIEMFV